MPDLNATGNAYARKGSVRVTHTCESTSVGTTAVATPIVIQATPEKPVFVEGSIFIRTVSGGTSPTVGIGTTTAATNLVGLTASTASAFIPASNAVGKAICTADTPIYIIEGGTPNGAGVYDVLIDMFSLNPSP